jgi:PAS domain S-box-containing protein
LAAPVRPGAELRVIAANPVARAAIVTALTPAALPTLVFESLAALDEHDALEGRPSSPGGEALDAGTLHLRSGAVAAVVVDVPRDGDANERWRDVEALRARLGGSTAALLAVADHTTDEDLALGLAAGADDVVERPFRPGELLARLLGQLRLKRTVEELARRSRDAELLVELTQALASSLELREILYTVVARIAEVVRVDRVSIVLVREHDDRGFVVVSSDDQKLRDLPIELERYPEIQRALSDRQPLVIEDAATHPLLAALREAPEGAGRRPSPFASIAIVPLLFEDRPMGVFFLRSRVRASFDAQSLSLCKTLANATAVGLRNARILQSLRDQTQQITFARYEAERRMRALQRFADFFESIDDGVCVMDAEGRLLFANPVASELTGYAPEDLLGKTLKQLLHPDDKWKGKAIGDGLKERKYPRAVDLRVRRKDDEMRIFSLTFSEVLHEEHAVLLTFRDVTKERLQSIELQETKDFLEHLIDSSVDAIVSADMEGRILLFNRAAERVYGKPATAMLGTSVEQIYQPGIGREIMRLIRKGRGRLENFRTDVVSITGEQIPISLSAALIQRGDRAIGTVGIFTDLRERMRIEQRLAHAQEQLRAQEKQTIVAELAGAAAHELNQPLTSVMGYAELLRRRLDPGTPQHHAAEIIVSEAERMAEIVRKIGKITRYETKSYVGAARILDLDRASREDAQGPGQGSSSPPPSSGAPRSSRRP